MTSPAVCRSHRALGREPALTERDVCLRRHRRRRELLEAAGLRESGHVSIAAALTASSSTGRGRDGDRSPLFSNRFGVLARPPAQTPPGAPPAHP